MFALPIPDYERHPKYGPLLAGVDDALRREALAKFMPAFDGYYRRLLDAPRRDFEARIGEGDAVLRALQDTGCATLPIPPGPKARLEALAVPIAQAIDARLESLPRPRFRDTQQVLDPARDREIFEAVEQILEGEGVQAAASAYAVRELALRDLAVQVNTERLTAAQYGPLDADGLPSPRTSYMHIDSAVWPHVKVLIYLGPVGPDQGPFRYVEGSHRLADDFELAVRKVNDREATPDRLLMALPPPFRMHTVFGELIDPDGPDAARLLARERACCDGSDLILFDFNGVHRGGFVRQGRRYMLQCHFQARWRKGGEG